MAETLMSFDEVAKHNKKGDCWLMINAKVYNVSPFLEEHPGGEEAMLNATGKDASGDFEDIGHSSYAEGLMKEYLIGKIDESTLPKINNKIVQNNVHQPTSSSSNDSSKFLLYALSLLMLGVAFLFCVYTLKKE